MINTNTKKKVRDVILSFTVVLGIYVFCAYFFDFFYYLNDDMAIKDILSGIYTGKPDGHTNQVLYPLGWLVSCFYKWFPKLPIFGFLLCTCFGSCFAMISYRIQKFFWEQKVKYAITVLLAGVFLSFMLWELIYVQYTVVCGVLAGTACFWFYTTPIDVTVEEFWKENFLALILVWLGFFVRSEMLLLITPFLAVAGIWHWAETTKDKKENSIEIGNVSIGKYIFAKDNIGKYIGFLFAMVLGLVIAAGVDFLAYRSGEWQEYRSFFNARTRVYDYTWYPDYEQQQEFYRENKISKIQYQLIDNYNFGLDPTITEDTMEVIASFGEKGRVLGSMPYRIKNAVLEPLKRLLLFQDMPYSCFVFVGYGLVLGLAALQKEKSYFWKIALLWIMRCIPWFYIVYVQRTVDRVIHPLYVIEFIILLGLLVKELYDRPLWNVEKYYRMAVAAVLVIVISLTLPLGFTKVKEEQLRREELLAGQQLWDEYAKSNPENYYYMDVYSMVHFMEKIFDHTDNRQKNYDLLGGWICHSPLQKEIMLQQGVRSIEEALLSDHIYFVAAKKRDISFVKDYYSSKGIKISLQVTDTVGVGENTFVIYQIVER